MTLDLLTSADEPVGAAVHVTPAEDHTRRNAMVWFWDHYTPDHAGRKNPDRRRVAMPAEQVVLLEHDGPAVQRPRGLDHEDLRRLTPELVYVSLTPFGRSGPEVDVRRLMLKR